MEDLNAVAVKRWVSRRLGHESLDYHVLTVQSFGKSNTPSQNCLEEQLNGTVLIVILQLRYVEGFPDGALPLDNREATDTRSEG